MLLRLDLAPRRHAWAPLAGTTARKPGPLTYGIELARRRPPRGPGLAAGEHQRHGVRALRCDPACAAVGEPLLGGDGTAGDAVLISVPLERLGGEGATLGFRRAYAAAGELTTGTLRVLDEVALEPASIPELTVEVAVAPAGRTEQEVSFRPVSSLTRGSFAEALPRGAGPADAWARVCLGLDCRSARVALPG